MPFNLETKTAQAMLNESVEEGRASELAGSLSLLMALIDFGEGEEEPLVRLRWPHTPASLANPRSIVRNPATSANRSPSLLCVHM